MIVSSSKIPDWTCMNKIWQVEAESMYYSYIWPNMQQTERCCRPFWDEYCMYYTYCLCKVKFEFRKYV